MSDGGLSEREQWRAALAVTGACPTIDELSGFSDGSLSASARVRVSTHLAGCQRCQTELVMLKEFELAVPRPEEEADVSWITSRLERDFQQITGAHARPSAGSLPAIGVRRGPWWQEIFRPRAVRAGALAFATVLVVIAGTLYVRNTREPALTPGAESGPVVLRSEELTVVGPVGDLEQPPTELRWQSAPTAVVYSVQVMEVDRSTLWTAESRQTSVGLPPSVRAKIAPGKTLLWQVAALDAAGKTVAASQIQRFRVPINPPQ